jgi:hypothetical protein
MSSVRSIGSAIEVRPFPRLLAPECIWGRWSLIQVSGECGRVLGVLLYVPEVLIVSVLPYVLNTIT